MAAIIICHAWESHRTAGRQSAYSSSSQSSFETSHSLQHRTFFMCSHTEREGVGRGESAVRKQCDHYMIELCFVVPVAMLTRKIPTYTPGIASVPSSARLEVINFVRKTCCCAPGKHIMAISCQFATPSPFDLLLPTNCLCVCACVCGPCCTFFSSFCSCFFFCAFLTICCAWFRFGIWLDSTWQLAACSALPCSALAKDNVSPYGFACACACACVLELILAWPALP